MFDKRKDSQTEPELGTNRESGGSWSPAENFNTRSAAVIGATIKIKGDISGDENLVIEGSVVGSVTLKGHDLTVGQQGEVEADLRAKTVKIVGQVTGDIHGEEKVIITKAGRVRGNITAPRVTLEDGAKFKGAIDMDPGVEKPVAVAASNPGVSVAPRPEPVEDKGKQNAG